MRNIDYNGCLGPYLPQSIQKKRVANVIAQELTPLQREALVGYYLHGKSITEMALERGVNKSTICRNLRRAETRLRRFLRY
mgnify:CR=1 FL=1